jgi:hypothetical protein
MPYVIKRRQEEGGGYAAPLGHKHSYVSELQYARTWPTRADAERECCGENESVRDVTDELQQPLPVPNVRYPAGEGLRTRRFVRTGEFREPRAGEWYLSGAIPEAWRAPNALSTKFHILRQVE